MRGQKTGGREAGTPNKRTADLMERLEGLGCDPLEGLARIADDPSTDTALRARVYADLLQYLYPKRKAVELSGADGDAIKIDRDQTSERIARKLFPEWFENPGALETGSS